MFMQDSLTLYENKDSTNISVDTTPTNSKIGGVSTRLVALT